MNSRSQEVWGLRYIDDAMVRLHDKNLDGDSRDSGELFWQLSDAQFSSVAVIDKNAVLQERVSYTAYGVGTHRWPHEVNNTGGVTTSGGISDYGVIDGLATANGGAGTAIDNTNYNVAADLNRDGIIDSTDTSIFTSTFGGAKSALASGQISDASGPDNVFGYDGYVYNPDQGLYLSRYRWLSAVYGRWLQRDPAGYVDGFNLYEYVSGFSINAIDPTGLDGCDLKQDMLLRARGILPTRAEEVARRQAAIDARLEQIRKNGISSTDDFIFWYYNANGEPISVSPSLERDFRDHELIKPVLDSIREEAKKRAAGSMPDGFNCQPGASWTVVLPTIRKKRSTVPYGSSPSCGANPFRDTYSYGRGSIWANVRCRVTVDECDTEGGGCKPSKFHVECDAAFWADDKFEEPLGIPRGVGGDVWGDPYWFMTRWNEYF